MEFSKQLTLNDATVIVSDQSIKKYTIIQTTILYTEKPFYTRLPLYTDILLYWKPLYTGNHSILETPLYQTLPVVSKLVFSI